MSSSVRYSWTTGDGLVRTARRVQGAERATIAGAAHLPNLERPEEFDRIVLDPLPPRGLSGRAASGDVPVPGTGTRRIRVRHAISAASKQGSYFRKTYRCQARVRNGYEFVTRSARRPTGAATLLSPSRRSPGS